MRFWLREVAGWLLLAVGLFVFFRAYQVLTEVDTVHMIEGGSMAVMGLVIFRGGIHLLKVAVAAEVCLEANQRLQNEAARPAPLAAPSRRPGRDLAGRRL